MQLTCSYMERIDAGKDNQGKHLYWHERCNRPAQERILTGMLTSAKATLCDRHYQRAIRQSFVSDRGWPLGKVEKKEKEAGYQQTLIQPAVK